MLRVLVPVVKQHPCQRHIVRVGIAQHVMLERMPVDSDYRLLKVVCASSANPALLGFGVVPGDEPAFPV